MSKKRPSFSIHDLLSKKPNLSDHGTPKSPNRPRLNSHTAIMAFSYFNTENAYDRFMYNSDDEGETREDYAMFITQKRALLLCQRFLTAHFCNPDNDKYMAEIDYSSTTYIELKFLWQKFTEFSLRPTNPEYIAGLIRISRLSTIKIKIDFNNYNNRAPFIANFQDWLCVCRALKENKNLTKIFAYINMDRSSTNRIIFDLIPNKIIDLLAGIDIMSFLDKRRRPLNRLTIVGIYSHTNFSQIFAMRTKRLNLTDGIMGHWDEQGLLHFANCGTLPKNPLIEHLKVQTHFCVVKEPYFRWFEINQPELKVKWKEEYLPKYERALKSLSSVNSNVIFDFVDFTWYVYDPFEDYDALREYVENLIENAKLFIDLLQKLDIKIGSIKLKHEHEIFETTWSHDSNTSLATKLGLQITKGGHITDAQIEKNDHKTRMTGLLEYNGVKFELEQSLEKSSRRNLQNTETNMPDSFHYHPDFEHNLGDDSDEFEEHANGGFYYAGGGYDSSDYEEDPCGVF